VAKEKECQCKAIDLLSRMSSAYNVFLSDVIRADGIFSDLVDKFTEHLEAQYKKPEYAPYEEEYLPDMTKVREAVRKAWGGETKNVQAMETIRTTLHKKPYIRQMFLCGPPYKKETETKLSKDALEALELLENAEPKDADKQLEKIYKRESCTKGG